MRAASTRKYGRALNSPAGAATAGSSVSSGWSGRCRCGHGESARASVRLAGGPLRRRVLLVGRVGSGTRRSFLGGCVLGGGVTVRRVGSIVQIGTVDDVIVVLVYVRRLNGLRKDPFDRVAIT